MKKVTLLFMLLTICLMHISIAQKTISGTVTDSKDGSSIPGVNVIVKGTSNGTITDLNGNYAIKLLTRARFWCFHLLDMKLRKLK